MRGWRFVLALAVMGVMSLGGGFLAVAVLLDTDAAHAQTAPQVLRAAGLEIVDAAGTVRARLGVDGEDSAFDLYDNKGTRRYRATYQAELDRVSVLYSNKSGDDRFLSALTDKGECLLSFVGEDDDKLMTILAGGEQASTLLLKDPTSNRMVTTFAGRGQSVLQLSDAEGRMGWLASIVEDGRAIMALAKDGRLRIRAMTNADTSADLSFLDDRRNKTWSAGE